jgi:hypothetical protein
MLKGRLAVRRFTPICDEPVQGIVQTKESSRRWMGTITCRGRLEPIRIFYGRKPGQLALIWGLSLLLIVMFYWLETSAPVLHDLLQPFYYVVFFAGLILTWRWLRGRTPKDRRGTDRRHADRRNQNDLDSS